MNQITEAVQPAAVAPADEQIKHPDWCDGEQCWAYTAEQDQPENGEEPAPGGFHESAWVDIPTLNRNDPRTIGVHARKDHGKPERGMEITLTTGEDRNDPVMFLSVEQATLLRDTLDHFLGHDALTTAFELGSRIYRRKYINAALGRIQQHFDDTERNEQRAYANGYTDALDGRPAQFEVTQ